MIFKDLSPETYARILCLVEATPSVNYPELKGLLNTMASFLALLKVSYQNNPLAAARFWNRTSEILDEAPSWYT